MARRRRINFEDPISSNHQIPTSPIKNDHPNCAWKEERKARKKARSKHFTAKAAMFKTREIPFQSE